MYSLYSLLSLCLSYECCVLYRKLNMQHELVKELAVRNRRALCVVIGVVKTSAPSTISATLNFKVDADEKVCCLYLRFNRFH